jgi:kynurenine formamidase
MSPDLPRYDELPVRESAPPRSSWGLWGDDDVLGCLNLLSPDNVVQAARLVRAGRVFPLDWKIELPDPPLFGRPSPGHRIRVAGAWQDDELETWNTQSSSQWDGFRHVRSSHGHYGGLPSERHGVHHWARNGIVGRCVLVDLGRQREKQDRPLRMDEADPIAAEELAAAIAHQRVEVREGDILLLRTGWVEWYETCDEDTRRRLADDLRTPGLRPGSDLLRLLWDLHIAAVAADNPSVEHWPPPALTASKPAATDESPTGGSPVGGSPASGSAAAPEGEHFAHLALLPLLGLPLGELFALGALAADCERDGVYEGLFTSAPLNLHAGVASPPNALVIK